VLPDSVPIPMLPPRKRLKASQCDSSTVGAGDIEGNIAEVDGYGHANEKCDDSDLRTAFETVFEPRISSVVGPDAIRSETVHVSSASVSATGTVVSVCSSDVAVITNLNSTAKNSFASLSAATRRASLVPPAQKEPVRRGRKSCQTTAAAAATNPPPSAFYQDWAATNGSEAIGIVQPTAPAMVATPTPNVIHIPEDSRVLRTEDGMIIVCQSDGTVQIHGHTEGQPIPLDAIRNLLALDTGDQTAFAVSDSKQIPQETSHSLYGHAMPLTGPETEYAATDQMVGTVDVQNLVSVDGQQYVAVDGSQTLVAYDPNTQSMVQIDPRQAFITLSDDSAFVPADGTQPVLSLDGGCHVEHGVVSNSALIHLLPNDHVQ